MTIRCHLANAALRWESKSASHSIFGSLQNSFLQWTSKTLSCRSSPVRSAVSCNTGTLHKGDMPTGPNGNDSLLLSPRKPICHGYLYAVRFMLRSQNWRCSWTAVSNLRFSPFPTSCIRLRFIWAVCKIRTGQRKVVRGGVGLWCHSLHRWCRDSPTDQLAIQSKFSCPQGDFRTVNVQDNTAL